MKTNTAAAAAYLVIAVLLTIAALVLAAFIATGCSSPPAQAAPMPPATRIQMDPYIDAPPTEATPAGPQPAMEAARQAAAAQPAALMEGDPIPGLSPEEIAALAAQGIPFNGTGETSPPAFAYVWCSADTLYPPCPGEFPIWRDGDRKQLFCTIPTGSKVKAPYRDRFIPGANGRSLAFVVTGADGGGGSTCAGWTWADWIRDPDWEPTTPTAAPTAEPAP